MAKFSHATGRKKRSIARATVSEGSGSIIINSIPLESFSTNIARMKIMEPLILADSNNKVNIKVDVHGGGYSSQADAVRLAVAKGLVKHFNDKKLKETFLSYDRNLLVADTRVAEASKPNDSKPRAKRQKSYR